MQMRDWKKQAEQERRAEAHGRHNKSSKEMISQIHKGRDQTIALQSNESTVNRATSKMKFQHERKTLTPGNFQSPPKSQGLPLHMPHTLQQQSMQHHCMARAPSTQSHRTSPSHCMHQEIPQPAHSLALDTALHLNPPNPTASGPSHSCLSVIERLSWPKCWFWSVSQSWQTWALVVLWHLTAGDKDWWAHSVSVFLTSWY